MAESKTPLGGFGMTRRDEDERRREETGVAKPRKLTRVDWKTRRVEEEVGGRRKGGWGACMRSGLDYVGGEATGIG